MKPLSTARQKSFAIAAALLAGGLLLGWCASPKGGYAFPESLKTVDEGTTDLSDKAIVVNETFTGETNHPTGWTNYRDKRIVVDETFTSNLPLIVLDTGGQEPHRGSIYDKEKGYHVPRDFDPYAYGSIYILDRKDSVNSLSDDPVESFPMKVRIRGNSSSNYDKHPYLIRLLDEQGKNSKHDLLGLGADNEWILNVSFIDKSLLRNYLAYVTIGEVMPYVPDARFCEVIWKDGSSYEYKGVYLLVESVSVGKYRVDLPRFSENAEHLPFLIRRDRYNETGVILENKAAKQQIFSGYLDIKWPEQEVLTERSLQRITDQIDQFEDALLAKDYDEFIQYRDMVDIDSFVDYFILNEYFLNYDAGYNSTYLYSDYSGKLHMGPVWDFDQAMDNNEILDADLFTTAFHAAPWFQQMLRDPEFVQLIVERYRELRESILSDDSIQSFIDQTVVGLGSAINRDWARWGYYYQHGGYLKPDLGIELDRDLAWRSDYWETLQIQYPSLRDRNTKTHAEEVEKIKRVLSEHGAWLDGHFDSLYQFSEPNISAMAQDIGEHRDWGGILAVVFLIAFFVSLQILQRLEREE